MTSNAELIRNAEYDILSLFELTPDLVCIAGRDGYFRKVNPAVINTLGYTEEEIYTRSIMSFMHPEDLDLTIRERDKLLQGTPLLNFQNRYLTKDGRTVWLEWTSFYIPEKEIVFAIAKDITGNKNKESAFLEKLNTYKNLAHHFKERAEEDRKFLAHELHEEVAQLAASLKLHAEVIKTRIEQNPSGWQQEVDSLIGIADKLVKSIRRISFFISPSMLEDLGFNETMDWICREYAVLQGISCQYESSCDDDVWIKSRKSDVFRLVQQAMNKLSDMENRSGLKLSLYRSGHDIVLDIYNENWQRLAQADLLQLERFASMIGSNAGVEHDLSFGQKLSLRFS